MDSKLFEIAPLEREQRLYERVVDKIIDLIQGNTWGPGDRLPPERDLAEAFGVSRTVVREAVKVLEARGVLGDAHRQRSVRTPTRLGDRFPFPTPVPAIARPGRN